MSDTRRGHCISKLKSNELDIYNTDSYSKSSSSGPRRSKTPPATHRSREKTWSNKSRSRSRSKDDDSLFSKTKSKPKSNFIYNRLKIILIIN